MARENEGVFTAGLERKLAKLLGLRDSNTLWRITSWGAAAALAMAAAVLLTTTDNGSQQLRLAFAPEAGAPAKITAQVPKMPPQADKPAKMAVVASPPPAKNADTERLEAQIRELAADRDRLKERIASLEQNLNDMTGSIKRELEIVAATASKPEPVPTEPAAPAVSAPQTALPPDADEKPGTDDDVKPTARAGAPLLVESAKAEGKFAAKPEPRSEPRPAQQAEAEIRLAEARLRAAREAEAKAAAIKSLPGMPKITAVPLPPLRLATAMEPVVPPAAASTPAAAASTPSNEPALGIELGGARSMEILKKRWAAVQTNFGPLVKGMHPLVSYDRKNPRIPYRLLVGPLANGADAAQTCKRFAASRVTCRPTRFVGDVFAEN